jgi:hypothetical protein
MGSAGIHRLKELEEENRRLERLYCEEGLAIQKKLPVGIIPPSKAEFRDPPRNSHKQVVSDALFNQVCTLFRAQLLSERISVNPVSLSHLPFLR